MLYFYIGETVQNANLINIGRFEENKANVNADNFSNIGKSYLAGIGMPGKKSTDITLAASGSTYVAPASGWYVLDKTATASGQYMTMSTSGGVTVMSRAPGNFPTQISCPIAKGDTMTVMYSTAGSTNSFKFIYAEGEEVTE